MLWSAFFKVHYTWPDISNAPERKEPAPPEDWGHGFEHATYGTP